MLRGVTGDKLSSVPGSRGHQWPVKELGLHWHAIEAAIDQCQLFLGWKGFILRVLRRKTPNQMMALRVTPRT